MTHLSLNVLKIMTKQSKRLYLLTRLLISVRKTRIFEFIIRFGFLINILLVNIIYPTKKKRTSKIFPLSSPFNAKMLIVIKLLFLVKSYQNSSLAWRR